MHRLWAAALLLRRLRGELGVALLLMVLVVGSSFLLAAAPRLLNKVADDGLRYEMAVAPVVQRTVVLGTVDSMPAREPGVGSVEAFGEELAAQFPASLTALIGESNLLITTARFAVADPPQLPTFITLRYQGRMAEATELVDGRWPVDTGERLPPSARDPFGEPPPPPPAEQEPVHFEIAISDLTAEAIGVTVGDQLAVDLDPRDPLLTRFLFTQFAAEFDLPPIDLVVSGIYHVTDPEAAYWLGDRALQDVTFTGDIENPIAFATALFAAEAYPGLVSSQLPFRYNWRYGVDPNRLDVGQLPTLVPDLQQLTQVFTTSSAELTTPGRVVMRHGLLAVIARYQAQRASSEAVLTVAALGPFALAGGAIAMVALRLANRRRATLALTRGRGASGELILGAQAWEAALLVGLPAAGGLLLAESFVPGRGGEASIILALAFGIGAVVALVAAALPAARRPAGQLDRDDPPVIRVAPRRLVIEGTVVVIAVAGALLLRQRGLTVGGGDAEVARFDPLLAAVPVLVGLAVGLVATRLYPLPIRGLGWLAARRRDLVPVLGLRRVGRHAVAANLPLLVLLLTAAFGAFASMVTASVDRGQVQASWEALGADFLVHETGHGPLTRQFDPASVAGVQAVAPGLLDPRAGFSSTTGQRTTILLLSVEPQAYDAVLAAGPLSVAWPAALRAQPTTGPIPVIVSRRMPVGGASLRVGDTVEVGVRTGWMTFEVAAVRDSFPGVSPGTPFVVAPWSWLQAAVPNGSLRPNAIWISGPPSASAGVRAERDEWASSALLVSRHEQYDALHDAPLVAAIAAGFLIAAVVCALYAAFTVVGALTLSAAQDARDLAFLRTMGVSRGQSLVLTLVEHGPPILLALIPGVVLGVVVAFLLEPGLGLSAFTGSESGVTMVVDWPSLLVVSGALLVISLVAVAAGTWLSRRAHPVDALRIGGD